MFYIKLPPPKDVFWFTAGFIVGVLLFYALTHGV